MKQEMLGRWANHYAAKLGLTEAVRVGARRDCPTKITHPRGLPIHIHVSGEHRGLVCWDSWKAAKDRRGWRWIVAHEVCHLKVKSHSSPYFARWMASLGFARERRTAMAAGLMRHRHDWQDWVSDYTPPNLITRRCHICGATQEGKVSWGPTRKGA